ncbi:MarR family winged helix-turn-helix transcriptional regulator [Geodermatophilus sp. URMC 61]|uniref:MarR family winged helix-turn-helix transcriptional regulator n=1 Tax=Geodermatophilus sp. URMC 61 TaxID=3423411 RepID=UPI00406D2DBB
MPRRLREPETNTTYLAEQAAARLEARITAGVAAAGHPIRVAHSAVFVNIDRDGTRLTQLAERAQMTPQAMSELVDHLAAHGYLERVPDPSDRRAKLIVLTDLGCDALQAAFDTIIGIEAELEGLLGRDGLRHLRTALRRISELPPSAPTRPAPDRGTPG